MFTVGLANGSLRERAQREANVGAEIMFRASGSMGLSGSDALRLPVSMAADIEKVDGVAAVDSDRTKQRFRRTTGLTGSRLIDGVPFDEYAADRRAPDRYRDESLSMAATR